ncbi:hypothetical protein BS47DRAFT_1349076 [Hydnum rufescens UP504]|uniref:Uncharacterized protein n=1 Tax=Hydnum rufescens UP504 TaxID=1448309 RepID=A0A9P6AQ26_9AGAM|nr:hypothetical protein BS47DRAFT_1349076 [Hydnum rufescens UP504]
MQLYDIFDPNGYNNVFAFSYPLEPVLVDATRKEDCKGSPTDGYAASPDLQPTIYTCNIKL